jgi:ATP-dependent RNA helicase HelY
MFDAESAALIRSAPALEGVDPALLPQELTAIYADLAGLRLRAAQIRDDPAYEARLARIARIATIYEALVDSGADDEDRRAAAFVAGTAYQVLGRISASARGRADYLTAAAIDPNVAAPLLFLIAGQSPDAREAARGLAGPRLEDIYQGILLETIEDLAQEDLMRILERAERIGTLLPQADASLGDQSVQALYLLCWSGIVQMVAGLLGRDVPPISYDRFETAQAAFDQVAELSTRLLEFPADDGPLVGGAQLYSVYAGPRHLARLLRHVADTLEGVGIIHLPAPAGADHAGWRSWLRHRAASKPTLWPNHRAAVATGFLDGGRSAVLVLPTGAGKTTVSELKIAATLTAGRKVVFLVPTLALVDQLRDDLADSFPQGLANYEVSADGDLSALIAGPELKSIEVMTPERFLAVLSFVEADTTEIGLIVFDECHLLSPHGGGSRSVDAMLCLLHAIKRAPDADLLLLSAMLRNADEVADWLRELSGRPCEGFTDPWKPSRQARGVVVYPEAEVARATRIVRTKARARALELDYEAPPILAHPFALFGLHNAWARNLPADYRLVRLSGVPVQLSHGTNRAAPNSNKVGASLARSAALAGLKTIMFVQQADHAPSTAIGLRAGLPAPADLTETENGLWQDIVEELGGAQRSLIDPTAPALPHNGDMIALERRLAESLFRKTGGVDVIVATPTLAQGMNLPAQVAILAGTMRHDEAGRQPLKNHEILNAAGRAGRAGHLANGTVLLVPEPVVAFSAAGIPTQEAFGMLEALLPLNDQCLNIDDPLTHLFDSISAGHLDDTDVRYFLSRLRAGEEDDVAVDRAVEMMGRSFAAFRARRAGENAELDAKLAALKDALEGEAIIAAGPVVRVAAFTGLAVEPLAAIVARIEANIDALPTTVIEWVDWLIDFFIAERPNYELLLGKDIETVKAITRGRKTGGPITDDELQRLKYAIRAWMGGLPFDAIERALGVVEARIGTCKRSRDLVLRLANRTVYLIATATSELARETLARLEKVSPNPAALEVLGVAIRKGMDLPDKVAFSYLSPALRTRTAVHREYSTRFPTRPPTMGQDYQGVLNSLDAAMAFGPLLDGAGLP